MGSQTGRTSPTCLTSLTRPRPNTDSCSFAFFVNIRGLKTSIEFPLFPSHESHKSAHKRERANNSAFLRVDFLIASASTIRMSADSLIVFLSEIGLKNPSKGLLASLFILLKYIFEMFFRKSILFRSIFEKLIGGKP